MSVLVSGTHNPRSELSFERSIRTELSRSFAIHGNICPLIWPIDFPIAAQSQDRLNGERHARFTSSHSLVLGVVRDPRGRVELRVDTMATPSLDNGKSPRGCVLFDDLAKFSDRYTWFDNRNGHVQGLPRRFNESDRVRIRSSFVTNVVSLIQVGMISTVVDRNVEIENVPIKKNSLIGDTVAYNLIWRCTQ